MLCYISSYVLCRVFACIFKCSITSFKTVCFGFIANQINEWTVFIVYSDHGNGVVYYYVMAKFRFVIIEYIIGNILYSAK